MKTNKKNYHLHKPGTERGIAKWMKISEDYHRCKREFVCFLSTSLYDRCQEEVKKELMSGLDSVQSKYMHSGLNAKLGMSFGGLRFSLKKGSIAQFKDEFHRQFGGLYSLRMSFT